MFGRIALFELRYQWRRPIAIVSMLVLTGLAFTVMCINMANYVGAGAVFINASEPVARIFGSFSILTMLVSIALFGDVALRDAETRMDEIMRTQPVNPAWMLGARFAGAYVVASLVCIGVALGCAAAAHVPFNMPWTTEAATAPFRPGTYLVPLTVIALPNVFATGAIFFTVATLSRRLIATYIAALVLLILYMGLAILYASPAYRTLAAMLDPFGRWALAFDTVYWTTSDLTSHLIPLNGLLLWNRMLWIAIGVSLLVLSFTLYTTRTRGSQPRAERIQSTAVRLSRARPRTHLGSVSVCEQLALRTHHELRSIVQGCTYASLLLVGLATCIGVLIVSQRSTSTPDLPVSYAVIDVVGYIFAVLAILMLVTYCGELVWRDRKAKIAAIVDATPTPSYVFLISKIAAVTLAMLPLLFLLMATGISFQLYNGITQIDFGFYLMRLVLYFMLPAMMYGVLAIFIQTVVNQKFVGLLVVLAVFVAVPLAGSAGIENNLLLLFEIPDFTLSDMNGYGHFLPRTFWFCVYWGCISVLIAIAAHLLWVRGVDTLRTRIRMMRRVFTRVVASLAGLAFAGTAATAGFIYWNTRVLNEYTTTTEQERLQVDYEKIYGDGEQRPQPRIAQIDMTVDLYPDRRGFRSRGRYLLINRTDKPIEIVHVVFLAGTIEKLELEDGELIGRNTRLKVFEFRPLTPFAPGETRTLTFDLTASTPGFQSGADLSPVVYNGSFVHNTMLAPRIGVQRAYYLQSDARRRAYGLADLQGWAKRDDPEELRRNLLGPDADLITFTMTISTSADQIALAPGDLESEWSEGNRRFFRYRLATPSANFWSVVSGRYSVARDQWNGIEVAVYYDPKHGANVPHMLEAMKAALQYYSVAFAPFPHRTIRIVEFPRYQSFAQSFPTLVPYSESVGFIKDLRDSSAIDMVWLFVAHELAHQWWGHQLIPANVEGAQFLSESLSEYSAIMVAEHLYGPHKVRQWLKSVLDAYLRARRQSSNERPLARATQQDFVHYQKGMLAMYALKDAIGEEALNRALARFLRERAYQVNPYPTSLDLLRILREEAGPEHDQLITDLFDRITFWDLRVVSSEATERPDGKWIVRVEVQAAKLDAGGNGKEEEVPLDQLIDIGLFADDPTQSGFSDKDVILLQKHRVKGGRQIIELVVDRKPTFVGVDPYANLISRTNTNKVAPLGKKAEPAA